MSSNELWDIKLEIGNYCNLKCPHCARNFVNEYKLNTKHVSLETIKNWLPKSFLILKTSKKITFSGVVVEPSLNPEFLDIVNYFLVCGCNITLESNGSTNNESWWYELGKTNIKCYFTPDSLVPNNNLYRINSNTDKVISNMKAFISGGGFASWKYLPFKHNENEYDAQKSLAKKIGATFSIVQPGWFDAEAEGETMVPSKYFPNSKVLDKSKIVSENPQDYCNFIGNGGRLLEISPDGIIYPCCYTAKPLFSIYAPFCNVGDPSPYIDDKLLHTSKLYKNFVDHMLPLIEEQGGIKTLSLNYNKIVDILNTNIFIHSLKKSWSNPNKFCLEQCRSRNYILQEA